jgi:ribosome-binding protein aMBF1 (putative translation factor)
MTKASTASKPFPKVTRKADTAPEAAAKPAPAKPEKAAKPAKTEPAKAEAKASQTKAGRGRKAALAPDTVLAVRADYGDKPKDARRAPGGATYAKLAAKYDVSIGTIIKAITGTGAYAAA